MYALCNQSSCRFEGRESVLSSLRTSGQVEKGTKIGDACEAGIATDCQAEIRDGGNSETGEKAN